MNFHVPIDTMWECISWPLHWLLCTSHNYSSFLHSFLCASPSSFSSPPPFLTLSPPLTHHCLSSHSHSPPSLSIGRWQFPTEYYQVSCGEGSQLSQSTRARDTHKVSSMVCVCYLMIPPYITYHTSSVGQISFYCYNRLC